MIPKYQEIMLPILRLTADGLEHHMRDLIGKLSEQFGLTEAERNEMLPSGVARVMDNRSHWARKYLLEAGLFQSPKRGYVQITERGQQLLTTNPESINTKTLRQYPEFVEFMTGSSHGTVTAAEPEPPLESDPPDETMREAFGRIQVLLANELLSLVKRQSPEFFESLVLDLLRKMGYGGVDASSALLTKASGDEGIDGIIYEDKLGLDTIYVQAKRWDQGTVGRPEIQKFVGALQGQRARKGVFITTSRFSAEAQDYVHRVEPKIVLIDGAKLAQYMIEFGVGVSPLETFTIKRVDADYFEST